MNNSLQLVLYRDMENGEILSDITSILDEDDDLQLMSRGAKERFTACCGKLAELAKSFGFRGNLWHDYLTLLLVNHENAFSKACEIRGAVAGSINELALHDFRIFKRLFDCPFEKMVRACGDPLLGVLLSYESSEDERHLVNRRIRDRICSLAAELAKSESPWAFKGQMEAFYRDFGVGKLGLHKAFRVASRDGEVVIEPITRVAHVNLEDLVGYEKAKQQLIENTEAFICGRPANNCLLFGDAGTGKSSSIKGIMNRYYERGLRVIELYRHQFRDLSALIAQIKNRNYRFIIYLDDLSFEESETEYKYLKAVIEGGLEKKPDNILIYATSNRRHLVRERSSDKLELMDEDDLHSSDTVQEKLSLAYRFGVRIYYAKPEKKEFQNIVRVLAGRRGIAMDEKELLQRANEWEISHGGPTGRTASQFIDYLEGTVMN